MTVISFTRLIEILILPPAGPLILFVTALFVRQYWPRLGYGVASFSLCVLYLAATPLVSQGLIRTLEPDQPLNFETLPQGPAAIVVIAGPDLYPNAPEYGGRDTAGPGMLMRLRYAAQLQQQTGLPLAVIGGDGLGRGTPAAEYMQAILETEFQVPVRWSNGASRHTFDNARYTHAELSESGINQIYLVTHAWHMRRAALAFEATGFEVTPAPTLFVTEGGLDQGLLLLLPRADALVATNWAMHEFIGLALMRIFTKA